MPRSAPRQTRCCARPTLCTAAARMRSAQRCSVVAGCPGKRARRAFGRLRGPLRPPVRPRGCVGVTRVPQRASQAALARHTLARWALKAARVQRISWADGAVGSLSALGAVRGGTHSTINRLPFISWAARAVGSLSALGAFVGERIPLPIACRSSAGPTGRAIASRPGAPGANKSHRARRESAWCAGCPHWARAAGG